MDNWKINRKMSDYPNISVITLISIQQEKIKIKTQGKIYNAEVDRTKGKTRQIHNHDQILTFNPKERYIYIWNTTSNNCKLHNFFQVHMDHLLKKTVLGHKPGPNKFQRTETTKSYILAIMKLNQKSMEKYHSIISKCL